MAEPRKIVQGGLKALEAASKAVDAEDAALAAVKAAERAAAGRRAADVAKATAPMKMSEALGNMNVEGKGRLKITQADRTRVGGGNIGGPMFSGLQQVDPIYEGAAWGVGDKSTASKMINQSDENTFWTTVLGSADQLKTNPIVFNKLRKGFVDSMKQGNLSDELADKINHNLSLVFGEGADIRDPKIWQKANTFEKRGALADAMLGQGVPPSKGGVALGGEKSGKGVIFRPTDILKRETEPALLHPEHGGDVPSFSVGPRLFTLSGDVKERPDLHPGFPVILQGEDKGVVFTPVPGIEAMPDYVKRHEAVKGRKPSGYFDWTMGLKGEGLPTQPITEEYLTYLQKMGKKKGGPVQESEKDMAEFQKRFALHKATGGKVNIPHLSLKKADGGKIAKGLAKALKTATEAVDAPAVNRLDMNFKDVTKRVPELTEAANKLGAGELSPAEYDALVNKVKPVTPYSFVPQPATTEDAMRALTENKRPMFGKTGEMTAGEQADLRLDIPAYKDHGVWVNSIHRKDAPTVYGSTSSVKNATMIGAPDKALKVAQGGPKAPFAVIRGDWNPMDEATAVKNAQKYLNHKDWRQVGYDPERHGYFYDRTTMEPITNAEEVIQIGPLVLAKKPVYGKKSEEKYADGGKALRGALTAIQKATKAVDAESAGAKALTAAEREANLAKFLEPSAVKDRLYHGTKNDIKSFDLSKRGNSDISSVGGGVYLTPDPNMASFYSKIVPGESGANVMPVHAQVKNPFEYDLAMPFKSQKDSNEFSRKLQEAGYDSIIKRDKDGQIVELVVFEPNKIKSAISNRGTYDTKDPDITKADGGAVQHDSLEDLAKFHERFALHKATGGKINIPHLSLKRVKKFDGGGVAAADVGEGIEDKGPSRTSRIAEKLYEMAKEQGKEEIASLKKPRAVTDLLNRGMLANNPVSAGVDLVNTGLGVVGLGSEKPFLGSEHIKDLMDKYGVTSGEERPLMETALSFVSPTAVIKGAQKTADVAKKAPEMVQRATNAFTSSKLSPLATEAKTASAGKPTGATYATKQEGPFFRVRPTALDQSTAKGRGVREADELQGQAPLGGGSGSSGSAVPTRISDEEVARIIADPAANEPLNIAKKYTQETQGTEFVLPQMPESSLVKQSAIGRVQEIASEGSPEYKRAIFDAYAREMPEVLEQAGAKNYDDLMEKAYRQMAKETDAQFQALPYNFSYHRAGEGNYQSSTEMAADVHGNKHLYVYQGGDPHDFLNRIDPVTGLNENEKFRAVHDLLGHAIYGNQFGPKGEEVAWAVHSQMYSPLARLAMTAETRGQNSMVNYSPINAALKAEIAKYDSLASEARRRGDTALLNEINAAKRQAYSGWQYAPNKAVLLPPEFLSTQYAGGMPSYLEAANRPAKGTETQSVLTHFSHNPELQFVDPKRYGTGIKGAEAERLRDFPGGVRDRSYFYMGEPGAVSPEPGLGVNRYRGEASSLYDITQDPLNFRVLARESNRTPYTAKYNQGITSPLQEANDMERLVKEYGYQGMANPKASKPMAIMFKETPVRRQARGGLTLMK